MWAPAATLGGPAGGQREDVRPLRMKGGRWELMPNLPEMDTFRLTELLSEDAGHLQMPISLGDNLNTKSLSHPKPLPWPFPSQSTDRVLRRLSSRQDETL